MRKRHSSLNRKAGSPTSSCTCAPPSGAATGSGCSTFCLPRLKPGPAQDGRGIQHPWLLAALAPWHVESEAIDQALT